MLTIIRNKFLVYTVCVLLIFWYITVIYWSKHPNVITEYRLYYMDRVLKDWPGYGGLNYNLGEVLNFGKSGEGKEAKNRGVGWSDKEEWGSWTNGPKAELFFVLNNKDTDLKCTMTAHAFSPSGKQIVDIVINGNNISTLQMDHSILKQYEFIIPRSAIENSSLLHMEFVIHNASSPYQNGLSEDKRLLGIGLHLLKIEKL